jgi:hypothetical protein
LACAELVSPSKATANAESNFMTYSRALCHNGALSHRSLRTSKDSCNWVVT